MTAITTLILDRTARIDAALPLQQVALVTQAGPDGVLIDHQGHVSAARIALSCLVQPEPGDQVLVALADEAWVTAVLSRLGTAPLRLLTTADVVLGAPATSLTLNAGTLNIHAATANTVIEEVVHAGHGITAQLAWVKIVAGLFETLAHRVLVQAKTYLRTVDEADQLRARTIDHAATATMHLQADCAFMTAATAIRLDAEQIHMG
jgi:hypothetical protein